MWGDSTDSKGIQSCPPKRIFWTCKVTVASNGFLSLECGNLLNFSDDSAFGALGWDVYDSDENNLAWSRKCFRTWTKQLKTIGTPTKKRQLESAWQANKWWLCMTRFYMTRLLLRLSALGKLKQIYPKTTITKTQWYNLLVQKDVLGQKDVHMLSSEQWKSRRWHSDVSFFDDSLSNRFPLHTKCQGSLII